MAAFAGAQTLDQAAVETALGEPCALSPHGWAATRRQLGVITRRRSHEIQNAAPMVPGRFQCDDANSDRRCVEHGRPPHHIQPFGAG